MKKYLIPQISALSLLSSAVKQNDGWRFYFNATDPSKEYLIALSEQEDCMMFYQAMAVLYSLEDTTSPCDRLSDVFVYIDFSGIFDRKPVGRIAELQRKAECLFRPEGIEIVLDERYPARRYIAFERSASMSRHNVLSFVREDVYEPLRERMMLGMKIENCQLSKLYAYNGLMFTGGRREEIQNLLQEKRIVVIDNPKSFVKDADIITVEDDGTDNPTRKYNRVEAKADVEVLEFDGEGIISKELSYMLTESGQHHSFQIRLPYIKGVVHEVDFKKLFSELRVEEIKDIWGKAHAVADVDMILTKSMFKGFGWMTENGLTWAEYLERCRKYNYALYISGMDKIEPQVTTELNYQFLNTLALTDEEFRPLDLPLGWDKSPNTDPRHWLTKTTEAAYYDYVGEYGNIQKHFTDILDDEDIGITDKRKQRAEIIEQNPLFMEEAIYAKELSDKAESVRQRYAVGQLLVAGDNRYLSDDLMRLLAYIVGCAEGESKAYRKLESECLTGNKIYAPKPAYEVQDHYTLLRSPHIARNEEALVCPLSKVGILRKKYLSHLRYVVMVDSRSLIPDRLGGADYDGDMVKTIADPLVNKCIRKGYDDTAPLPVLKIPSADPIIADANDWHKRMETVKSTFSSRVGQISNAALRRGIIAYDENSQSDERVASRQDTEVLAILTGLEIDSAKSGVKPDLSEYLEVRKAKKSLFLQYKSIVGDSAQRKWYQPTTAKRVKEFIGKTDWDNVSSNLEKLPYYAYMLDKETLKHKANPATDAELFTFAQSPNWQDSLDQHVFERTKAIIAAYHEAMKRNRFIRHIPKERKRQTDIERILFARGQENLYSVDELYSAFDNISPFDIRRSRLKLSETAWHLTPHSDRMVATYEIISGMIDYDYRELFCDFRHSGYRILGDIICDLDDMYRAKEIADHVKHQDDGKDLSALLSNTNQTGDYRKTVVSNCIYLMTSHIKGAEKFDLNEVLKCAVALGERQFALEVMPMTVFENCRRIKR
ncbi:hypothetical protein [uncultured Ruminococcus sp.]|uniref:RNA dependent RNA polymerase n=1 Tax=uncultured Ruminococcus sp. TaxID=165186 RepID=UPI0029316CD1|nr:hypothetical protein [uncultured Ruminococcus sp.]